jgi:hypothetical protein
MVCHENENFVKARYMCIALYLVETAFAENPLGYSRVHIWTHK